MPFDGIPWRKEPERSDRVAALRSLTQNTDATGAVTNMTYDALDRILTRAYPADSSINVAFTYDQGGHGSGVLRLTSVTDAAGNLSQDWNERGLLTESERTNGGNTYTTEYAYDSAGRLAEITYASSDWVIGYKRDAAGQITYVSATEPGQSAVNLAAGVTYLPFGPITAFTYGNGITHARTYDNDYRVTSIIDDAGASNVYDVAYTYDSADNILTVTDNVTSANNQALQYDSVDRLVYASGSYGTVSSITYDSNSNRLTYGATNYTISGTSNRLTNDGTNAISYISTGNMSAIGSNSMTYNKASQLATATVSGTTSTYTYDAFGRRMKYQVGAGTPVVQQYDAGWNLLVETGANETNYVYFDFGVGPEARSIPIAAINPNTAAISAIHTDRLGTPQKASNSGKSVVWSGDYQPFGTVSPSASITMNLRFPGQYADSTGFYHNGFRDYIPAYGRYLESDPIGLKGGLNTYAYVLNNPLKYIDPFGLEVKVCCRKAQIVGGLVDHCWITTDTKSGGMSSNSNPKTCRAGVGDEYEYLYFTNVYISDHSCQVSSECTTKDKVDEACVNEKLNFGEPLGKFTPTNNCQSFVNDVISACPSK